MPTTFADLIDGNPIYAARAVADEDGVNIKAYYAKLADFAAVAFSGAYSDLSGTPDLSIYAQSANLAAVATSGDYDDLLNKPTIPAAQVQSDWSQSNSSAVDYIKNKPQNLVQDADYVHTDNNYTDTDEAKLAGIEAGAEVNVQADWNQSDSNADDYIKNKPSIPAAQVQSDWDQSDSGAVDYIKNKPSIPAAQVQSDWNQADNTQVDFIKNKPSIPAAQVQSDWNQSDNTQVDFIKNKPSIPAAQVQSDWNQSDNTQVDFIKNKPSIPVVDQTYNGASANAQSGAAIEAELSAHYQKKIVVLEYGISTWTDFSNAFSANSTVFLKDGAKYAILAYVANALAEFQYIQNTNDAPWERSKNAVLWKYTIRNTNQWEVITRPLAFTPLAGGGIKFTSNATDRTVTFDVDIPVYTSGSNSLLFLGSNGLLVKSSAFASTTVTNTILATKGGNGVYAKSYTGSTNRNIGNQYSPNFDDALTNETATIGFVGGTAVSMTFNANNVVKWDSSSSTSIPVGTGLAVKYGLFSISPKSASGTYGYALDLEPIKILDFGTVGTIAEGTTSLTVTPTLFAPASFNNITIEKGAKLATMFYSEVNGVKGFYVNTRNPYGDTTISIAYDRTTSAATLVEEAPASGAYIRKDRAWVETEVTLWSGTYTGSIDASNYITLSEAASNFKQIQVEMENGDVYTYNGNVTSFKTRYAGADKANNRIQNVNAAFTISGTTVTCVANIIYKVTSSGVSDYYNMGNIDYNPEARPVKIVGIGRIASN